MSRYDNDSESVSMISSTDSLFVAPQCNIWTIGMHALNKWYIWRLHLKILNMGATIFVLTTQRMVDNCKNYMLLSVYFCQ